MTTFLEAVRRSDWEEARELLRSGQVLNSDLSSGESLLEQLIDLNAPPELVVELLRQTSSPTDKTTLSAFALEACLRFSLTKENASATFVALLDSGSSPNVWVGGATLLQRAMHLNRVPEVREMLSHGVDPNQCSLFGIESATNVEEASTIDNAAARLVMSAFNLK